MGLMGYALRILFEFPFEWMTFISFQIVRWFVAISNFLTVNFEPLPSWISDSAQWKPVSNKWIEHFCCQKMLQIDFWEISETKVKFVVEAATGTATSLNCCCCLVFLCMNLQTLKTIVCNLWGDGIIIIIDSQMWWLGKIPFEKKCAIGSFPLSIQFFLRSFNAWPSLSFKNNHVYSLYTPPMVIFFK